MHLVPLTDAICLVSKNGGAIRISLRKECAACFPDKCTDICHGATDMAIRNLVENCTIKILLAAQIDMQRQHTE